VGRGRDPQLTLDPLKEPDVTEQNLPPMDPTSSEASQEQLDAAKAQGDAYGRAVQIMTTKVADGGGQQRAGDYVVGYALEKAEGMYQLDGGELRWQKPQDENLHLEVIVSDAADGRFVPGLTVRVTVVAEDGTEVGTHEQPLLWHPMLYHYGRNWKVPGDGTYTVRVHIDPAPFGRHDEKNGKRYVEPVDVEFNGVQVSTGQA
jgi:hypothetical protein